MVRAPPHPRFLRRSAPIRDWAMEIEAVNGSEFLFLCPNAHGEQSALGCPGCISEKTERIQRGFGHPVHKGPMAVPEKATAAQAGGDLIQGDMR